jgi:Ca-activated chloride channel homolog
MNSGAARRQWRVVLAVACALGAELPAGFALGTPLAEGAYDTTLGSASAPAQAGQLSSGSSNPAPAASSQPAAAPVRRLAETTNVTGGTSVTGLPPGPFATGIPLGGAPLPEGVYDIVNPPIKQVEAEPVSTFSINVDTAYYGFARRSLMAGYKSPYWDEVRVEEMINYFPYAYPRPESAAAPLQPTVTIAPSPWKPTNKLVHIGIKGYEIATKERPRANLVFLIDVHHGGGDDRLPLLRNAFGMLLDELKPKDTVSIVTYAPDPGAVLKSGFEVLKPTRVALEPTPVAERGKIADALSRLTAEGSAAGCEGLENA